MEVADLWFRDTARFTDANTHAAAMAALKSQRFVTPCLHTMNMLANMFIVC
jgi:hypothetical protein